MVTVFDDDRRSGSISSVELSFGCMEEPNVERALEGMARIKEIELNYGLGDEVHLSAETVPVRLP